MLIFVSNNIIVTRHRFGIGHAYGSYLPSYPHVTLKKQYLPKLPFNVTELYSAMYHQQ